MTKEQQRYLNDRLNEVRQTKPRGYDSVKLPKPAAVLAAESAQRKAALVIRRFEKKCEVARKKRNELVDATVSEIRRIILFGDAKAALKALDRFAAKKF